jgi:tRNA(Arg) A34 adenosine deaminase TadA
MTNPFMARAIELSMQNVTSGEGGPFATVIVKDGQIVAEGTNRVTALNDPTAHAEIVAIREACVRLGSFELSGCEIYATCEPCPMCLGAIYWTRPLRVYFGNTARDAAKIGFDDAFIYDEMRLPPDRRHVPMIPLMRDEAQKAFQAWQQKPDKTVY